MDIETSNDPYAIVLADLRAQKAKIEQAIEALEALQGKGGASSARAGSGGDAASNNAAGGTRDGELLGLSIPDAAKKILQSHRKQMTTADILLALERGGVVLTSADKMNTVGSILLRRFQKVGDIVRVTRGVWGLQEWYPGRRFPGSKRNGDEKEVPKPETKEEVKEVEGNEVDTEYDENTNPFDVPANPGAPQW